MAKKRSFECSKCDKSYSRKENLLRHVRCSHGSASQSQPRCSPGCDKVYSRSDALLRHQRTCPKALLHMNKPVKVSKKRTAAASSAPSSARSASPSPPPEPEEEDVNTPSLAPSSRGLSPSPSPSPEPSFAFAAPLSSLRATAGAAAAGKSSAAAEDWLAQMNEKAEEAVRTSVQSSPSTAGTSIPYEYEICSPATSEYSHNRLLPNAHLPASSVSHAHTPLPDLRRRPPSYEWLGSVGSQGQIVDAYRPPFSTTNPSYLAAARSLPDAARGAYRLTSWPLSLW